MKVLCLGSICLDVLIENINEFPRPNHVTQTDNIQLLGGGGALNTAIALRRLGVDSYPMGEVGYDYGGQVILNILDSETVNTSYILQKETKKTSVVAVLINGDGERSFICNPGNFLQVSMEDYDWDILSDVDFLLIGSSLLFDNLLPEMPSLLKLCREHNVTTLVDTVWPTRPTYKLIENALPYMDYFTPSLEEAQVISGLQTPEEIAKWCLDHGTRNVVLKMDKRGCFIANQYMQITVPALQVPLVDSTGAGDCFLAGFITALSKDYSILESAQIANAAGAMCVQSLGGYSGISNFEDLIEKYLKHYAESISNLAVV